MEHWNDDLLRDLEEIVSKTGPVSSGTAFDDEDESSLDEAILRSFPHGFAVHRLIYDEEMKPADYTVEKTNPVFCRLLALSPENVVGRKASDLFGATIPYFDIFSKVALTGEAVRFKGYYDISRKYLDISAFSPRQGFFCALVYDVTDHVLADRERRSSQQFIDSILESVDIWVALLDEHWRAALWSRAGERISGYFTEEVLSSGFNVMEKLYPDERYCQFVKEQLSALSSDSADLREMDTTIRTKAGENRVVSWSVKKWCYEDENTSGILAVGRDVTEIRGMEGALRESERRYASTFLNSRVVMFIVDPEDGRIVDCNDAACEFYGYTKEEFLRLKNTEFNLFPPEELKKEMKRAKADERNFFEFPHRTKDGAVKMVEVHVSSVLYDGKTFLYSIVHDVTGRTKLEDEMEMLAFGYALQNRVLRGILDASSECVYVLDRDGRVRSTGRSGASLFGLTPEAIVGQTWSDLSASRDGMNMTPFEEHRKEAFFSGKSKRGMIVLPTLRGDKPFEYVLDPIKDDEGNVDSILCSLRDMP